MSSHLGHHHFWHFYQCCLISDDISSENVIRWHVDQQWHVCCLGMTSFWPEMTAFWGKNGWFLDAVLLFLARFGRHFSTLSHLGQKCHQECCVGDMSSEMSCCVGIVVNIKCHLILNCQNRCRASLAPTMSIKNQYFQQKVPTMSMQCQYFWQ